MFLKKIFQKLNFVKCKVFKAAEFKVRVFRFSVDYTFQTAKIIDFTYFKSLSNFLNHSPFHVQKTYNSIISRLNRSGIYIEVSDILGISKISLKPDFFWS